MLVGARPLAAQDSLERLKDLYASAAYEDALSEVARIDATEPTPEVEQYRVFCLVALGRTMEAEKAVEDLIKMSPRYRPDSDASPRIQELFSAARRRLGPSIAKAMYIEARKTLDRRDRETAIAKFEELLRLVDDPDVRDEPTVSELKLLGSGFLELSRAQPGRSASLPGLVASNEPPTQRSNQSAALTSKPVVTPPVAVREVLPPWTPGDVGSRTVEFRGAVRVHIDAQGKVADAEMATSIHPLYDRLLLQAARTWVYQPARSNGVAVPSEKVVQIVLKPR
jgi:TonB family protein